ncbi:MAG TPA: hypothetical protein VNI79_05470 [Sphingomicrobium sp.]|nr:hypothetical protein [Sphingomicrobium sp.]
MALREAAFVAVATAVGLGWAERLRAAPARLIKARIEPIVAAWVTIMVLIAKPVGDLLACALQKTTLVAVVAIASWARAVVA